MKPFLAIFLLIQGLSAHLCAEGFVDNDSPFRDSLWDLETYGLRSNYVEEPQIETRDYWVRNVGRDFDDGIITTAIGSNDDVARRGIWQDDGKLLVVGYTDNGTTTDIALVRYHPDGTLDLSFGTNGAVVQGITDGFAFAHDVVIDSNQRIIIGGRYRGGIDFNFMAYRFNTHGVGDATFGLWGTGFMGVDFGERADFARAIAVQSDDKIILGGYTNTYGSYDFAVARLTAAGLTDGTFGSAGLAFTTIGTADDVAHDMWLAPNGEITLVGYSDSGTTDEFSAVTWSTDGTLDAGFSGDGRDTWSLGAGGRARAYSITQKVSNNKFGVVGRSHDLTNFDVQLVRWDDGGAHDNAVAHSFSGDAIARGNSIEDIDSEHLVAARIDNGSGNYDFGVLRYQNNTLALQASWNGTGSRITAIGTGDDDPLDLVYRNGKIAAVGRSVNGSANYDIAVIRYQTDGTIASSSDLDFRFSADGINQSGTAGTQEQYWCLAGTSDNKVYTGGYTAGGNDVVIHRYNTNGDLDAEFGVGGIQTYSFGGGNDRCYGMLVDSSDRPVFVGRDNGDWYIARVATDGTLDATFGTSAGYTAISMGGSTEWAYAVAEDSTGKYVLAGFDRAGTDRDPAFARVTSGGVLDQTFGPGGTVTIDVGTTDSRLTSVDTMSDNRIVGAGWVEDATTLDNWLVIRLTTAGNLDATFNSSGMVSVGFDQDQNHNEQLWGVVIDSSTQQIYAGGSARLANREFGALKLLTNGSFDTSYGTGGGIGFINEGGGQVARGMTLTRNKKVIVVGDDPNGGDDSFGIGRFGTDGNEDASFGGDGFIFHNVTVTTDDQPEAVIETADGMIVVSGTSNFDVATDRQNGIMRVWP